MVDEPKAADKKQEPERDAPAVPASASSQQATPTEEYRENSEYILRPLYAVGRRIQSCFDFFDRHHGSFSASATLLIGVLTIFYVCYSKAQWQTMQQQLLRADRPWVGFVEFELFQAPVYEPQPKVVVKYRVENSGKGAALDILVTANLYNSLLDILKEPNLCDLGVHAHPMPTPFAENGSNRMGAPRGDILFPNATSTSTTTDTTGVNGFSKPSAELFIQGCIVYFDTFGLPHHTRTCSYIEKGENFSSAGVPVLHSCHTSYAD